MSEEDFNLFERYKAELEVDTYVDEVNVRDVQMKLPGIKHKWIARLIQAKADLKRLNSIRFKAVEQIKTNIKTPVNLSDKSINNAASKQEIIQKIDKQITHQELVIDYLTRIEQVMKSFTYDIKNIIDIMKMEST